MSGIIFNQTNNLENIIEFYTREIGASIWLDQGKCVILKHNNLLFAFCRSDNIDNSGIITFFYQTKSEVNKIYMKLKNRAISEPKDNVHYKIYNFFAKDPEDRKIEFQTFNHRLKPFYTGEQTLTLRRSVRDFTDENVPEQLLNDVFELCRYSPTSKNTQAFYYLISRDRKLIEKLASQKEHGALPLLKAPVIAAVCIDPDKTIRPEEDACISATYLMLAATQFGLGTCWIGGMNINTVKNILSIPENHYIACLTPIGYPAFVDQKIPHRRNVAEFVKEI